MRKTVIALVLSTLCVGFPAYAETRHAATAEPLTATDYNAVPAVAQIRIQVERDRRHRRDWRRYESRRHDRFDRFDRRNRYDRYNRYNRYRRW